MLWVKLSPAFFFPPSPRSPSFSISLQFVPDLFLSQMYTYLKFLFSMALLKPVTGMICQLKKLQSWLEGLFIMQHSVMVPVVELLAVLSLSFSFSLSLSISLSLFLNTAHPWSQYNLNLFSFSVYYVGPDGWKKLSGDDVGELHYHYYPVMPSTVEQEMVEVTGA